MRDLEKKILEDIHEIWQNCIHICDPEKREEICKNTQIRDLEKNSQKIF